MKELLYYTMKREEKFSESCLNGTKFGPTFFV